MTSTTWGLLSRIWHLVFPLSFIGYTLLKDEDAPIHSPRHSLSFAVLLSAAGVLGAVDIVTWFATSTSELMPRDVPLSMLFERSQSYWNGASANLLRSKATKADPWVIGLRRRRPPLVVAVALANKTARIAWAVMLREKEYQPRAVAA
jgi:hypothetical protein